jgi:hypothetical protein
MKKAKIVLAAVGFFAVLGGAFAFKANKFLPPNVFKSYLTTVAGQPAIRCSLDPTLRFSTTGVIGTYYSTTLPGNICTQTTTTFVTAADL